MSASDSDSNTSTPGGESNVEVKIHDRKKTHRKGHWIPVVAGFLRKDGKVLVGQRPETHSLAGQWEFPGGKIELGESPEVALARELNEELGIHAEIGELKLTCTHTYGDVGILILFYDVPFWKGEAKPIHHLQLEWIYPGELKDRQIPEANRKILDKLLKALGK
jgi:8-oxo-dGTP diphosphatase